MSNIILNDEFKRIKENKDKNDERRKEIIKEYSKLKEKDLFNILSNIDFDSEKRFYGSLNKYKSNKYVSELLDKEMVLFKIYCFEKNGKDWRIVKVIKDELKEIIGNDEFDYSNYLSICNDIDKNFELKYKMYINNVRNVYFELMLKSGSDYEFSKNFLKYILDDSFNEYIEYLEEFENIEIKNYWDKIYYVGNYIKNIVGLDFINFDVNVLKMELNRFENKDEIIIDEYDEIDDDEKYFILDFFSDYEKKLKSNKERLNNKDIIEISWDCKDRIIELFKMGVSKRKLIDVISNELWDKNIIDRKVKRSIRRKNVKNLKEMVDNKISKNVVDKVIEEYKSRRDLVKV